MNKRMRKILTKLGVALAVTAISSSAVLANESDNKPKFSRWAVKEINDALSYGLIDPQIVQEDMTCPISEAKYMELCENVAKKIEEIPGTVDKGKIDIAMPEDGVVTKQDMMQMLYEILMSHEYSIEFDFNMTNLSTCMEELEVVKGDGKSDGLEDLCTVEQAVAMSRRFIESTYDLCDADSKGLFWKVESNGNTAYILGSIHIGKAGIYPLRDEIMDAYEVADEMYTEIDFLEEVPKEVMDMHYYLDGTTVKDYLSEEYYEKLTKLLKEYNTTPEQFGNAKDWFIMQNLDYLEVETATESEDLSENDTLGMDYLFAIYAQIDGKETSGLETYEGHVASFDTYMSQEVKTHKFEQAIDIKLHNKEQSTEDKDIGVQNVNQMLEDWKEGDTEKLNVTFWGEGEKMIKELPKEKQELEEQYAKALIHDRDQIMADSIDKALQSEDGKTYFIIAGAAHFVSDTGVLTRLEEKGYKVERIE